MTDQLSCNCKACQRLQEYLMDLEKLQTSNNHTSTLSTYQTIRELRGILYGDTP